MAGAARMTRLRRVPTVLQLEALECGAAALGMVLAHHGRWTPLVELRRLCGVSRDGSKASSLLRAGRSLGLDADGYRLDIDDLAAIAKPAIVYVNENHFVVLEGMRRGRVEVNDPAGGRVIYTREEFAAIYSGVALTFKPNDAFRRGGERPRVLLPLARRLAGGRAVFVLLVATGIALAVPAMVIPAFTRAFVDQFVIERQDDFVPWLIIAMLGTLVVQLGLLWIQGWAQLALRNRIAVGTASAFTWRVLRMPIAFFGQRSPSSIGARSDMAARLADQASGPLPALAVAIVSAVLFAALMFQYSPTLTTISIGIAATASAVALLSQRKLGEGERKASLDLLKLGSRTMQGLMLLETIKASGTEDEFIEGWTGQQAAVVSQQQRLGRLAGVGGAIGDTLGSVGGTVSLVVGAYLAMQGRLTLGLLLAFLLLQATFFGPVRTLIGAMTAMGRTRATLDQFEDVEVSPLAAEFASPVPTDRLRASGLGRVRKLEGRVELRDVSFGYARLAPPLVTGLSLSVEAGSSMALVGASGSGKSTVAKLVAGLHESWSGAVLVDGVPLADLPRALLRNSMSVVDQDISMFTGTVRDNITLWDTSIPEERVVRAAKDAMIHDDILRRAHGYDDRVQEDGANFSGGQRQRLEIARALVTDPTVLILDEATSALDSPTEKTVMDNLKRRGCTCIVIAHRLSTVRDCDEIVVVDRGAIVERGTHEELLAADGAYCRLLETADHAG